MLIHYNPKIYKIILNSTMIVSLDNNLVNEFILIYFFLQILLYF